MSEKILIASDSTTDLSPELIEKYQIKILQFITYFLCEIKQNYCEIKECVIE